LIAAISVGCRQVDSIVIGAEKMQMRGDESQQPIAISGHEQFQRARLCGIFRVLVERAGANLEQINKGDGGGDVLRIHDMQAHRRQVRILAICSTGLLGARKTRRRDNAVHDSEDEQPDCDFAAASSLEALSVRIRGSSQNRSMSARKFPAARTIVENKTPPMTT